MSNMLTISSCYMSERLAPTVSSPVKTHKRERERGREGKIIRNGYYPISWITLLVGGDQGRNGSWTLTASDPTLPVIISYCWELMTLLWAGLDEAFWSKVYFEDYPPLVPRNEYEDLMLTPARFSPFEGKLFTLTFPTNWENAINEDKLKCG